MRPFLLAALAGFVLACEVTTGPKPPSSPSGPGAPSGAAAPATGTDRPEGPAALVAVAAGRTHTCTLDEAGAVACWGGGRFGQLGDGSRTPRGTAAPVPAVRGAVELRSGGDHVCVRTERGGVYCWGRNDAGQTGTGERARVIPTPRPVVGLRDVAHLAAGADHTCAATRTGHVYCWGRNEGGAFGRPHPNVVPTPVRVPALDGAIALAAGRDHTCGIVDGRVRCIGRNDAGQRGTETDGGVVRGTAGATALVAGAEHTCAAVGTSLRCWGKGSALGRPKAPRADGVVAQGLAGPDAVRELAAGAEHTCLRNAAGRVLCFGEGTDGRIGGPARAGAPRAVPGIVRATALAAGDAHTCVVTGTRIVRCFGRNDDGALGDGSTGGGDRLVPADVPDLADVAQIDAGEDFVCARNRDGEVACWGRGSDGQLGNGDTKDHTAPTPTRLPEHIVHLSAGRRHACAVGESGAVYCFGSDASGQASARSGAKRRPRPARVPGIDGATAVACGSLHTCALGRDGRVRCFGADDDGQLGAGVEGRGPGPVTVVGLAKVAEIAAGDRHTCARTGDGAVWCWGRNQFGQLGNAADARDLKRPHPRPVRVRAVTDAVALSAGDEFTCLARRDRTAACFGRNDGGQLGSGTTMHWLTRVPVKGLAGVAALDAGPRHACAVRIDGTGACWGDGEHGKLGHGGTESRPLATPIVGLGDAVSVAAGGSVTCVARRGGKVACFGSDEHGQIGDGGVAWSARPVTVVGLDGAAG